MTGSLLLRGMLAGVFAALLVFGFARIFGEPQVDAAIAFEEQMSAAHEQAEAQAGGAHDHGDEVELVSRATQAGLGLFTGVVVYGTSLGGLFALAFAFLYGRIGGLGARGLSAALALSAFVAVVLVPMLKYPANPPSVGDPDTIGHRTALFFTLLALSVGAAVVAVSLAKPLIARYGSWNGAILAGAFFVVVIAIVFYILPPIDEVPAEFSASLLWRFRIASMGMQAILWTTIGLLFGALAERALGEAPRRLAPMRPALR